MMTGIAQPMQTRRMLTAPLLFAADLALPSSGLAQSVPVNVRNKAIIEASFDAWSNGTGGPFDLLADDCS